MTVLGGYLGAGKTTLVNELLADADPGERIAVVVNDFGEVNVDTALVRSRTRDTLELANGCVCCSLQDGMAAVLERLRALRPAPARVLVEVSGVGDPAAVAGWGDHPGFTRAGVVVCADVTGVRSHAVDRWVADTVLAQLRGADVVLLTRTDLAPAGTTRAVRAWVQETAPGAEVTGDRAGLRRQLRAGRPAGPRAGAPPPGADHTGEHSSWSLRPDRPVDREALVRALSGPTGRVVRVKGVLRCADAPDRRTTVQVAGGRVEVRDDGPWDERPDEDGAGGGGVGVLVVLARGGAAGPGEPELVGRLRRIVGGAPDPG